VFACWDAVNEHWQATFDGDCNQLPQTVTITLAADGNCCVWHLEATRGTVDDNDLAADCPRPVKEWTLNDISASVDMVCATCDDCVIDAVCCPEVDLPDRLYARICGPCGTWCLPLNFAGATATTAIWSGGPVTIQCTDGIDPENPVCFDITIDEIQFECLESGTTWQITIICDGTAVHADGTITIQCDPFCTGTNFGLNDALCGWTGSGAGCVDVWDLCVSESPC